MTFHPAERRLHELEAIERRIAAARSEAARWRRATITFLITLYVGPLMDCAKALRRVRALERDRDRLMALRVTPDV